MSRKRPEREQKREIKAAAQAAEDAKPKGFRQSWEFRSAKMALRIVGVLFFVGYICLTASSAWQWVQTKWELHYALSEMPARADKYLNKTFQPEKLSKAISFRPLSETEAIIKLLEPHTGRLSTYTFLNYSMRLNTLGKTDEALFWWQFARYRGRFDALRCGSNDAVDTLDKLFGMIPHPELPADATQDSALLISSIKKVLDLDAHYPADNIPEDICDPLRALEQGKYASVGVDRWADIRFTLRLMTERTLGIMERNLKEGKNATKVDESPGFGKKLREMLHKSMEDVKDNPPGDGKEGK